MKEIEYKEDYGIFDFIKKYLEKNGDSVCHIFVVSGGKEWKIVIDWLFHYEIYGRFFLIEYPITRNKYETSTFNKKTNKYERPSIVGFEYGNPILHQLKDIKRIYFLKLPKRNKEDVI